METTFHLNLAVRVLHPETASRGEIQEAIRDYASDYLRYLHKDTKDPALTDCKILEVR